MSGTEWRAVEHGGCWAVVEFLGGLRNPIATGLDKPTAHRIAAVNELEAALEKIDALSPGGPHESVRAGFEAALAVIGQARAIARAALAKARGET